MVIAAVIVISIFVGFAAIRASVNSETAFKALFALIIAMATLMAFDAISFARGIVLTIIISLIVLLLDESGVLE